MIKKKNILIGLIALLFLVLTLKGAFASETDSFNRADNSVVGNEWVERGEGAADWVNISNNMLVFYDNGVNEPYVTHNLTLGSPDRLDLRMMTTNTSMKFVIALQPIGSMVQIEIGQLQWYNVSGWIDSGYNPQNNTWMIISLRDINYTSDTYNIYVDDTLVTAAEFRANVSSADNITMGTHDSAQGTYVYVDWIDFSTIADTLNISSDVTPPNGQSYFGDLDTTTSVWFNTSVVSPSLNFTCRLYLNSTINQTRDYLNATNTSVNFNINLTIARRDYNWQIECNNSNTTEATDYRILQTFIPVIDNCSTYGMRAINFSIQNEVNDTNISTDVGGYFEVWIASQNNMTAYNLSWSNINAGGICIYPNSSNYSVFGQMEYTYPGFDTRTYYFTNTTFDNITNVIVLYLSNNTAAVTFSVKDQDDNEVAGAYIHVLPYDLTTNSYTTGEILRTDTQGEAIGNIILNTQWYKFFVIYNGVIALETEPVKITTTTRNFRINLQSDYYTYYNTKDDITTSLTFTNATRNFAYSFLNPTGNSVTACLEVTRRTIIADTIINESCLTASSGTILVNIGSPDNVTYIGVGKIQINPTFPTDVLSVSFDAGYQKFGREGIFFTFLIRLVLALVGIWNPVVAIVLLLSADILMMISGLYFMSWETLVVYVALALITMYRVGRK